VVCSAEQLDDQLVEEGAGFRTCNDPHRCQTVEESARSWAGVAPNRTSYLQCHTHCNTRES
jgi:hypothetical protein